jgi:hypothetical protein
LIIFKRDDAVETVPNSSEEPFDFLCIIEHQD